MHGRKDSRNVFLILVTGIFLLCGTLLFGGMVTSYISKFNRTLEEENRIRMSETGENIRTYMNAVVDNNRSLLQNVAAALMEIPEKDRMPYLKEVQEQDHFVYIGYAGADGMLNTTLSAEARDISKEPYFVSALGGGYAVTGVVREILKDSAASGVILAVPLPEGQGIVAAMLDLRQLEAALETSSFGGQGYSYIIDRDGNLVLYRRSMDYYNFFNLMDNVTFEPGYSRDAILNDIMEEKAGLTCYSNFDAKRYAYYCPLGINDWTVVNVVAKEVITQKTDALVYELIGLCAATVIVFLVLMVIAAVLYSQSQSRKRAAEAKSAFLANMSHDIRTPMNAIIGMTTIANRHLDDSGQVKNCLEKIESSSQYLLGLINDVLDMSKIESGKMKLHNDFVLLPDVISRMITVVQPMIKAKKQDFSISLHHVEHERILTDSLRLSQVFINILSNAAKFTPEGGKIAVDIEELQTDLKGTVSYRFLFSDTGIGMNPEFTKDIFSAFSRDQSSRNNGIEGTGLGMAISKKILDEMHGTISVKSQYGEGTVFTVELNFQMDNREQEPLPMPALHILAVNYDQAGSRHTVNTLHSLGVDTEWIGDKEQAAIKLREARSNNTTYDMVIFDVQSACTKLAECVLEIRSASGFEIPILFTCPCDYDETESGALAANVSIVRKPLFKSILSREISLLSGSAVSGQKDGPDIGNYDFTGCCFLLVEDNELNREIAEDLLADTGAVIETACNGEEGLRCFENAPVGYYTLILMDIQMPVMDGYTATGRIRRLKRPDAGTIPIIAMTANAFAEDVAACAEAGMDAHLSKPLDMQAVQETIKTYIR